MGGKAVAGSSCCAPKMSVTLPPPLWGFHSCPRSSPCIICQPCPPIAGVQADVTRLVEAGGGEALDAQVQQELAQAASVAAQLTVRAAVGC